MELNARQVAIMQALHDKHIDLAKGSDDDRRQLTLMIAEQIAFEFGPLWGTKAQTPTNPQSKDAIAYDAGIYLEVWDWQSGTTRDVQVKEGQAGNVTPGQFFIRVIPKNHLESNGGTGGNGHEVPPLDEVREMLNRVLSNQHLIMEDQQTIITMLTHIPELIKLPPVPPIRIEWPRYTGKLGVNLNLNPDPPVQE